MSVHSKVLASGPSGPSNTLKTIYTCPAGRTAIVKDLRASKDVSGALFLYMAVASGPEVTSLINRTVPDTELVVGQQPWIVLMPGDRLTFQTNAQPAWHYWVSGTELTGVAEP